MDSKETIPKKLLYILLLLFVVSLLLYFLISKSPRIEDLLINLSATILGILITLFIVDRIIKHREREQWQEFETIISGQISEILFTLCSYLNISSNLWPEWANILASDLPRKNKIDNFIKHFHSSKINKDYTFEIIKDDHLIDFFSNGYNGCHNRLDDFFRLYNNRLNAKQTVQIINLKTNLSHLISSLSLFKSLNVMLKEFKFDANESYINDFLENAKTTVSNMELLLKLI